MIDFASKHITRWKDGAFFDYSDALDDGRVVIVWYDQTNDAYRVDADQHDDFLEFVAIHWARDNEPQEIAADETDADYLDRIGVSILEG
jgi:hypothetical protein